LATDPQNRTKEQARPGLPSDGAETLVLKAERCRRLAAGISDRQAADVLRNMASQYEENARHLDH